MIFIACYNPIKAFYIEDTYTVNGKRAIGFGECSDPERRLELPCGRCIGCRLDRSRQWAVRCMHEAQMHEKNAFITLTYNDDNLPVDGSLHVDHFQKFMKRLRKAHPDLRIRFFHCGEYGEQFQRPHYHAIIFGYDFPDKKCFKWITNSKVGDIKYHVSQELERLWPFGYNIIGDVTFESCAYVARYILKKITGDQAEEHYDGRVPEYVTMSRRPGIGYDFYVQYLTDMFPCDIVVDSRGHKVKAPHFYLRKLAEDFPALYDIIKDKRKEEAEKYDDQSLLRLIQREEAKEKQIERLVRPFEKGM